MPKGLRRCCRAHCRVSVAGVWGVGVAAAPLLVADLEVDGLEVDGEMGVMDMCQCVFCLQLVHSVQHVHSLPQVLRSKVDPGSAPPFRSADSPLRSSSRGHFPFACVESAARQSQSARSAF